MAAKWILYGAYGYTGELILQEAISKGLKPIISGRREAPLIELSQKFGCEYQCVDLSDSPALEKMLEGKALVVHAAGPFAFTAEPMMKACLKMGVHYLDITGEIEVFKLAHELNTQAQSASVMLLPGCGYDIVPSDCLAAKLKASHPETSALDLVIGGVGGGSSKGTALSAVNGMGNGSTIRQDGELKQIPFGKIQRKYPANGKTRFATSIPWGDVFTAYYSTGVSDIRVFLDWPESKKFMLTVMRYLEPLTKADWIKGLLKKRIEKNLQPPTESQRKKAKTIVWGEAIDKSGKPLGHARLTMPEGYTLTASTAVLIAQKVLSENWKAGFQTPSLAYGKDLINEIEGVQEQQG
jgi:short subunit dehydrogenase-like uncharacterized protein